MFPAMRSFLAIAVCATVLVLIATLGLVANSAFHNQAENDRITACSHLPSNQRLRCVEPTPTSGTPLEVQYTNACNNAAANWENQASSSDHDWGKFPWTKCMALMLQGKSVPTHPSKR